MPNEIRLSEEVAAGIVEALANREPDQILGALEAQPDCDETRLFRIAALYLKQLWQEALDASLPEGEYLPEALGIHARCRALLGDLDGMQMALNRARECGMSRGEMYEIYAQLLRAVGRPHEADLTEAFGAGKEHKVMHDVKLLMESGRFAEALQMQGDVPPEDDMPVRVYRAFCHAAIGEHEQADAQLEPLMHSEISLVADLARSAKVQLMRIRGEYAGALDLIKEEPMLVQDVIAKIDALEKVGRREEAAGLARELLEKQCASDDRAALAECLLALGMNEEACNLMKQQDDLVPESDAWFAYRYREALVNLRAGGEKQARPLYDALLADVRVAWRAAPERWSLAMMQGVCYRDLKQKQKAAEMYEFLKVLRPDDERIDALGLNG